MSMQDTADANYMLLTVIYYVAGATQLMQRNDGWQRNATCRQKLICWRVYVNAAVEINVLDYNVAVVRSVNGVLV